MNYLILFLTTLVSLGSALAADSEFILKQNSGDGTFVFVRPEGPPPWSGLYLKDADTNKRIMLVKVLKCNSKICMGKNKNPDSQVRLSIDKKYIAEYLDKFTSGTRKSVAPVTKLGYKVHQVYGGYGGPLGSAFNAQYGRLYKDFFSWGGAFSKVGSKTNSVELSGMIVSAFARMEVLPFSKDFSLYFFGQLGMVQSDMTFLANGENFKQKETTFLAAVAPEVAYRFGDFTSAAKMGFSKSGLRSKYSSSTAEYSNPYGKLLAYVEVGLYYEF